MKAIDLARYIVDRCTRNKKPITYLMLQNMVYAVDKAYTKHTGSRLVDDSPIFGYNGACYTDVAECYSWYYTARIFETYEVDMVTEQKEFLNSAISVYRKMSIGKLIRLVEMYRAIDYMAIRREAV